MRRRLILLLALAMLAGLAGCGAEPETAPELASDGRRILTLGIVNSVPEARVLASLFNAQNKEYKIKIEEYKYGGSGKTPGRPDAGACDGESAGHSGDGDGQEL